MKNNFNFFRLLAATVVLLAHQYALMGIYVSSPIPGFSWAGLAVAIFFAISGYLVANSWHREPILWRFTVKRLLRLIPGLAFVCIFTTFVIGPLATADSFAKYISDAETWSYLKNIYLNLHSVLPGVFLDNPYPKAINASMWTLPLEANCYEMLAVLGLFGLLRIKTVILFLICACVYWDYKFHLPYAETNLNWLIHYAAFFFSGVLLSSINVSLRLCIAVGALSIPIFIIGYWFLGMVLLLPICVIYFGSKSTPIVSNLYKIGDLSYGVYLFAFPIQQMLIFLFGSHSSFFLLTFASLFITYALSYFSWKFIEAPALSLKKLI